MYQFQYRQYINVFSKNELLAFESLELSLIYVQLICKTTTSYLDNCRRSYPYYRGSLLVAARPPFNRIFHLKNPVKIIVNF